jgi:mannose-6-phosphate isomerase-like protein (cupin superfamily)
VVAVDTEVLLSAGDALFLPAAHGDDVRNAGEDTLVLLVANLYPVGEPPIMFMGTPTP